MRAIFVEKEADSYSVSKNDHCHEVGRCNKDIFSPIINLLPNIFSSVYHILTENKIGQTKWSLIENSKKQFFPKSHNIIFALNSSSKYQFQIGKPQYNIVV